MNYIVSLLLFATVCLDGFLQRGERQQLQSCHRRGPKTVPAQTAEITKCHVIFIIFFLNKYWW